MHIHLMGQSRHKAGDRFGTDWGWSSGNRRSIDTHKPEHPLVSPPD